ANVLTSVVSKQNPVKEIRLYGKVQADERLLQSQVSYLPGRIEKLFVNFTGESVKKGQTLAVIYSPDLVMAQQELLETATTKESQPILYEAAKDKLRQWKLTNDQIVSIESSGIVKTNFEVFANTTGIVSARRVNNGDYVSPGSVLFDVADLSHVWIMFDAYESDLPYLSKGQEITYTIQAMPGINYSGYITFIDPVLDPITRVARVRIEINNPAGKLKPEMFVTGIVNADLNQYRDKFVIPRTAVLWTGKRSVVYVKQTETDEPVFKIREIELGPMLGNSYVVESGLMDGEVIVTQGAFSVDASAQLDGKPSMMNPQGGQTNTMPGMDMGNDAGKKEGQKEPAMDMGNDAIKKNEQTKPAMDMGTSSGNKENEKLPAMDMKDGSKQMRMEKQMVKVSGNCEMCRDRIETAAKSVAGVVSAEWNIDTKMLQVEFDSSKTNLDDVQKVIAQAGHDTGKYKAPDDVYNRLPKCCLYRK
ncbi:MAG: efflux RND transporter periplasmic adaptor subunit, partial [Bacteroidales bacterium]